jgi:uridine phosphorylase
VGRYFSREDDQCLIDPRRGKHEAGIGPKVLFVLTAADLDRWRTLTGTDINSGENFGHWHLHRREPDHPDLSVAGPALGAPQAALVLEKLIALGGRRFLVLGWCGSLQPDLGVGQIVIARRAVSQEGTSRHYPSGRRPLVTSPDLTAGLKDALTEAGLDFVEGPVWTTDAPYRETIPAVRRFQEQGVLAVDMEASALMAVAAFRRVELALMMVVSDELHSLKWKHGFKTSRFARARDRALRLISTTIETLEPGP